MSLKNFLYYYENELKFLIQEGKEFSKKHPNIASTLNISNSGSNDPDVKKLIENIAFLNSNLQKKLDDNTSIINKQLLESIYPQFTSHIPSCIILNFSNLAKKISPKLIPKHTQLTSAKSYDKEYYSFETTMNVDLSPWEVTDIQLNNTYLLPENIYKIANNCLEINLQKKGNFEKDSLIFYINMLNNDAFTLYEAIMSFLPIEDTPVFENKKEIGKITPYGFKNRLLPKKKGNSIYDELIEFNAFKEKFLFFKIDFTQQPEKKIVIPLKLKHSINIKKENLLLNCSPAINLLKKTSAPIIIDNTNFQYKINPDNNPNTNFEIHSVCKIKNTDPNDTNNYTPYYSCEHFVNEENNNIFWAITTNKNEITNKNEKFISIIDSILNKKILYAKLLCSQKNANINIDENELWTIENNPGNLECINLNKPTTLLEPPIKTWQLISHLSINYFGFENPDKTLQYIKELFTIYNFNDTETLSALFNIKNLKIETTMTPYKETMIPQTNIIIYATNDSSKTFLLCEVIAHFLAKSTTFNTKFQFKLKTYETNEVWKIWKLI